MPPHRDEPATVRYGFTPGQVEGPWWGLRSVCRAVSLGFSLCKTHPENLRKYMHIFLGLDPKDAD